MTSVVYHWVNCYDEHSGYPTLPTHFIVVEAGFPTIEDAKKWSDDYQYNYNHPLAVMTIDELGKHKINSKGEYQKLSQ